MRERGKREKKVKSSADGILIAKKKKEKTLRRLDSLRNEPSRKLDQK